MGPPPDNQCQSFHWSCYGAGPDALLIASTTFVLPPLPAVGVLPPAPDDPRAIARAWLAAAGFGTPEEARARLVLPEGRRVVVGWDPLGPDPCPKFIAAGVISGVPAARDAVRIALVLSLCSTWVYDPEGPVLWTAARLRRRVRLGEPGRFHEPG